MNIQSVRRSLASGLLAAVTGFLVASCGGGGASTDTPNAGGVPSIGPAAATFYAGVPGQFVISNGRAPFTLTSSEPSLLKLPVQTSSRTVDFVPANPGVVDANLQPGELPVRTVNVSIRDANGTPGTTIQVKVGQNFLTGYTVAFNSNCPAPTGQTAPAACSGGETVVTLRSVTNGNIYGGRAVRFEVIKGPFQWEQFQDRTVLANTVTTTTDHEGVASAIFRVNANTSSQIAVLRVVDVATGVYVDQVFPISGNGARSTLTAIPNQFTFTGPLTGICGTGTASFMVFDGVPPYTAFSSDPNLGVSPNSTNANPAVFNINAPNSSVCMASATIVVTDSTGARTTVTVTTAQGTGTIPAPSGITVAPTSMTLVCGTSGSVSVVGGTGSYFVNSTHPRITALVSGNTVTITRLTGDGATAYPSGGTISITDGLSTATVDVTVPSNCP